MHIFAASCLKKEEGKRHPAKQHVCEYVCVCACVCISTHKCIHAHYARSAVVDGILRRDIHVIIFRHMYECVRVWECVCICACVFVCV